MRVGHTRRWLWRTSNVRRSVKIWMTRKRHWISNHGDLSFATSRWESGCSKDVGIGCGAVQKWVEVYSLLVTPSTFRARLSPVRNIQISFFCHRGVSWMVRSTSYVIRAMRKNQFSVSYVIHARHHQTAIVVSKHRFSTFVPFGNDMTFSSDSILLLHLERQSQTRENLRIIRAVVTHRQWLEEESLSFFNLRIESSRGRHLTRWIAFV